MIHKALSAFKSEWRRHLPHPVPHHAVPCRAPRPLPRAVHRTVRQGGHQQGKFIWCESNPIFREISASTRCAPLDLWSNGSHLPRPRLRHVGLQLHERRLLRRHPRVVHFLPRHGVHLESSMGHSIHDNLIFLLTLIYEFGQLFMSSTIATGTL